MRKIDTLRDAIFDALPELKRDPDRVRLWIERGTAKSTLTTGQGLVLTFQLNVLVTEMASDLTVLALAVFRWMRTNQPDLMVPGHEGIAFDADILDKDTADVLLQLQLDQAVSATAREDGGFDLQYQGERDPLFDDVLSIIDPQPAPLLAGVDVIDDAPPWVV